MTQAAHITRPPVVLIASDPEWTARSLESLIAPNGYAVLRAHNGRQALGLARTTQPDAIVIDQRLPDLSGIALCRMLRDEPQVGPLTPLIMTASDGSLRATRLEALGAGAWAFCSQPLDGESLLLQLRTFVAARRQGEQWREESLLDALTGLYSVRGIARRAREIGAEALRHRTPLACVALGAAEPNDWEDHATSKRAMRLAEHLGRLCQQCGRASDAIGRVGQLEFAVIAPATDAGGAVRLAERLQEAVESATLEVDDVPLTVRARAGYAAVANFADAKMDAAEMLMRATTALHHLRRHGNGARVQGYDELPPTATP